MAQAASATVGGPAVRASRLFGASCIALTCGAALFAITSDITGALKQQFILSNEQAGLLLGPPGLGFTIGIIILGPLCDALGMRLILRMALVLQVAGVLLMVAANGFGMLFAGSFLTALGSGAIEAACNPLIATIYPDKKTHKLSQFHMWFPGGIVLGGLACYGLDRAGLGHWQLKLAVVLLPMAVYGVMFVGQYFPPTERVQSGVSFGGMLKATLFRPLFLVLLACMMLTASLELGPNRWIAPVLQAGGVPGILVLVWITGLMAVLRLVAGPVVKWFTNTGLLLASAVVAGIGLFALSLGGSIYAIGASATVFAFGVCYFWPTMLGTVAERVPKGGAFALGLIGGMGGLFVNVVTIWGMGVIVDLYAHRDLVSKAAVDGQVVDREKETAAILTEVDATYRRWADSLGGSDKDMVTKVDISEALVYVSKALEDYRQRGALPKLHTAGALRCAVGNGPGGDASTQRSPAEQSAWIAKTKAQGILGPAESRGGLMAFRWVSPLAILLVAVFGVMYWQDRRGSRSAPEGGAGA
jgi:MFS family permease